MVEPPPLPIAGDDGGQNGNPDGGNGVAQQDNPHAAQDEEAEDDGDAEAHAEQVDVATEAEAEAESEAEAEADRGDEELDEVARHATKGNEADIEGDGRPRSKALRCGHGGRGRSASRAKEDTPAAATHRTTRSSSRSRPSAAATATALKPKQPPSSKAGGKRKATSEEGTSDGEWASLEVPSLDVISHATAGKGKGKQVARGLGGRPANAVGTLRLRDIMPVEIVVKDVPHV